MRLYGVRSYVKKRFGSAVDVGFSEGVLTFSGHLARYADALTLCGRFADRHGRYHVVNAIECDDADNTPMRVPAVSDTSLDGASPDVLIIGGGISGASIARELMRYRLDVLLVDKESDLAMHASGRNDGEVHPGVDLGKGTLKQHYVLSGNAMMDAVCAELDVPFTRGGQTVGFFSPLLYPIIRLFAVQRRAIGVTDTKALTRRQLLEHEPRMSKAFGAGLHNASAGCVCPYGLTIAYAENAVQNGARVSLSTAVLGMTVENGRITSVTTNRGTLTPRLVINAAGVFAEEIAKMADDRFYSIHPRRGTNSILDKKRGALVNGIAGNKRLVRNKNHTKGGGVLRTVDGNLLVGPNAVETSAKEDFATSPDDIAAVFYKQKQTVPTLDTRDIITCFSGIRACTFEEDFIIERGRRTKNLFHVAGIQSPGLTTAPAVALDVARSVRDILSESSPVPENPDFDPIRKGIVRVRELDNEARDRLIRENPDYGEIVCRCEQISKGEILDALRSPIPVYTVDGVKKRVRPGMGRCQGGFCMPSVMRIIASETGKPLSEVKKNNPGAAITFGRKEDVE